MSTRVVLVAGALASMSVPLAAQQSDATSRAPQPPASRAMLAQGMAMLDGKWSGQETMRSITDAMATTTTTGSFKSLMDSRSNSATVTNGDQVFNVRLLDGALVYSAAGRKGEQRREITNFFPVNAKGDWYISVTYSTPLADGKTYRFDEVYRMDGGVYTRTAQAAPVDGSGPPTLLRWGSFRKVIE